MKVIIMAIALLVLSVVQCVHAALITPGARLSSRGENVYQIAADNGLSSDDPNFFGAAIFPEVIPGSPTWATLTIGLAGSLTPGHMWYEVYPDQFIDPDFVLGSPTAFYEGFSPDYDHVVEQPIHMDVSVPFLLGFWIADWASTGEPDSGDVFGWAELVYDGTTLQLLDSAAENAQPGIVAGRYEAIPEPSNFALIVLGVGGIGLTRRRHAIRCS